MIPVVPKPGWLASFNTDLLRVDPTPDSMCFIIMKQSGAFRVPNLGSSVTTRQSLRSWYLHLRFVREISSVEIRL